MVHAPSKELEKLRWDITDKGYMSERVQENNVWNVMHEPRRFEELVAELSEHSEGDRWPADTPGAGLTKDGGWAISASGCIRMAAVKFFPEPAPFCWPDVGTRHTTALNLAYYLRCGVVLVRSETGQVHIITSSGAKQGRVCRASVAELERVMVQSQDNANVLLEDSHPNGGNAVYEALMFLFCSGKKNKKKERKVSTAESPLALPGIAILRSSITPT